MQLDGVTQVSVREKAGLGFATVLRAFLRQDPDVIMIGEIRDRETAETAVRAAQTGHLVLSTLHTNDAACAPVRLADIGIAPHHIAAALRLVTAQRLVRRRCPACGQRAGSFQTPAGAPAGQTRNGCTHCGGTGFRGRTAIHQLMPVSPALRALIATGASVEAISEQARREGVATLRDAGLAAAAQGVTSLDEVMCITESP
jgi:type IV pilus assembly protein PilB